MNEFDARTGALSADRLRCAMGSSVSYAAVDSDGSVAPGYPITLDAIVRHESTGRAYDEDGDIITETLKVAVRTDKVTPRIGDYLNVNGNEYAVTDIEIRGAGLTTITAQRIYNARVGVQQGFIR